MLCITVPGEEVFNDVTQEFSTIGDVDLMLEHSLVSLSKWESIFEKPFLNPKAEDKTTEETLAYVEAMILTPNFPPGIVSKMSVDNLTEIDKYINAKRTATWFTQSLNQATNTPETITSELIYYWMISLNIPYAFETWHLNRLLTLIQVCSVKNAPAKKLSNAEHAAKRREMNAQRRAKLGSSG